MREKKWAFSQEKPMWKLENPSEVRSERNY